MPDDNLRPASREGALFAIGFALNNRQGHALAATVAAEVVLAAMERPGLVVMQKPLAPTTWAVCSPRLRRARRCGSGFRWVSPL